MRADEIRQRFLAFFEARGHVAVPSSSLVPDDPSVLLTTAGMQQFKPYYTRAADPVRDFGAQSTASVQKSFRTSDIDEVGDESHLTFFEMLGNFSFGGYFKEEAIAYAHEFITKEMGLEISYVTIFEGKEDIGVAKDEDSKRYWIQLGIPEDKVIEQGMDDVFWGPTGSSGPCGPTTEIYCKNGAGQNIEIWNIVFNEFMCSSSREDLLTGKATLTPLPQKGIDTGMGLERLCMIAQNTKTIFETDLFAPLQACLPNTLEEQKKRVIADHLRGAVFLITDGIRPSNKGAGYILRRLLRRVYAYKKYERHRGLQQISEGAKIPHMVQEDMLFNLVESIIQEYGAAYPDLPKRAETIRHVVREEWKKFGEIIDKGLAKALRWNWEEITPALVFNLYQSDGMPFDVTRDFLEESSGKDFPVTEAAFEEEFKKHQEVSRAGIEKKFGGHGLLLDTGELKAANEAELAKVTRLHTATHLMQAALRRVLGEEARQMGSDITAERTRFDFSFPRKVTPEEIRAVEDAVNEVIANDYAVEAREMPYEDALQTGALHFFKQKYPERVTVYSVVDKKTGTVFSREFCGGPHISHTGEIGVFKITKEESSSAGVRRIRATVE